MFDGKAFGLEIATMTKAFLERQLAPLRAEIVELKVELAALKALPPGRDGRDGVDGAAGKDADPDVVRSFVKEAVAALPVAPTAEEVAALVPQPQNGKDGSDGLPGVPGAAGKDGVGLAGALLDHEGGLVLTMMNGEIKSLGIVKGRDGKDGAPGKDGVPGRDADPDAMHAAVAAEVQKQVVAPLATAYKGVWKPGAYKCGDAVTWAGSLFIAHADTEAKPESTDDWRLAVKRGRDGKDGEAPKPPTVVKLK